VPLSEHEQRILHELEQSLYQEDPDFAERVRSETVYRHAGRHCVWSALVFVAALAFMLATFSSSVALGFVGVVVMFLSGVVFANNARRMGKAGIDDLSRSIHRRAASSTPRDPRQWIRGRFHRED
jgi:predicted histidine transporter YuiF (NhaC family)